MNGERHPESLQSGDARSHTRGSNTSRVGRIPEERSMSADLETLFNDFDRGRLSRRPLVQALGVAIALRPASAAAQGQCGGAPARLPGCESTRAILPFEAT